MVTMAVIKIDDELLDSVRSYLKEGENRFDYPTIKAFIDKAVYNYLKEKGGKDLVKKTQNVAKEEVKREIRLLPEEKVAGKSKKATKFYKALNEAKVAIKINDISKARKLYAKSRNLYVNLESKEKKGAYDEMMVLYNTLIK